jgi:hypothetical protein
MRQGAGCGIDNHEQAAEQEQAAREAARAARKAAKKLRQRSASTKPTKA